MTMPAPVPKLSNAPTPEPLIGPGMILERGRERIKILSERPDWDDDYKVSIAVRSWFGLGWRKGLRFPYIPASVLRENIRDGYYRVIREADPKPPA